MITLKVIHLTGWVSIANKKFIHLTKLLLGDIFLDAKHRYRTKKDIVTMVVVWGLELGDTIDNVLWVVRSIVDDEWLVGLNSILEWVVPSVGFDVRVLMTLHQPNCMNRFPSWGGQWLSTEMKGEQRPSLLGILWKTFSGRRRQWGVV